MNKTTLVLQLTLLTGIFFWAFSSPQDSLTAFRVDSVEFEIRNAFDDAKVLTEIDRYSYNLLNHLRFKTRQSVVQKHLLFSKGDSITLNQVIESERILRSQLYFADADIQYRQGSQGESILRVITSDNWTTVVPLSLTKPSDELIWQIGLLENNFLGFGQSMGVYYGHDEDRDTWLVKYGNGHFLWPHHRLNVSYAKATDGYYGDFFMGMPFLSRLRNEWAYTIEATSQQLDRWVYWSESDLPGQKRILDPTTIRLVNSNGDSIAYPQYEPEKSANALLRWNGLQRDSVSLRLGRSMGKSVRAQVRLSWDYQQYGFDNPTLSSFIFTDGQGQYYTLDTTEARERFLPRQGDSRIGASLNLSHIGYEKLRNFHHIKWTEDVDRGWSISAHLSKNNRSLGAMDQRWFFSQNSSLNLGSSMHHLSLRASQQGYWNWGDSLPQDYYGRLAFEYIFKPTDALATVLSTSLDSRRWTNDSRSLSLGGLDGLNGLPSHFLVGKTRLLGGLEQRWFPGFELGTMLPVFVTFLNAGQVAPDIQELMKRDVQWVAGLGVRVGMSKSVEGVINHLNLSWPLNGPLADSWWPRFSILASVSL